MVHLPQMGEVQGEGKLLQCHVHFAEQKAAVQALHSWDQFYCGACVLLTLKWEQGRAGEGEWGSMCVRGAVAAAAFGPVFIWWPLVSSRWKAAGFFLTRVCSQPLWILFTTYLLQNWWSALSCFQDVRGVFDRADHPSSAVTTRMTDDTQRSPFFISSCSNSTAVTLCVWLQLHAQHSPRCVAVLHGLAGGGTWWGKGWAGAALLLQSHCWSVKLSQKTISV